MKTSKFSKIFVCIVALCIATAGLLVGCNKAPKEPPVLSVGIESVRIDKETEQLDLYAKVTAVDGNGKDIKERVKVKPIDGMAVTDGKATFDSCGDYTLTYTVDDGYGKTSEADIKVEVRNIYSIYLTNATMPPLYSALDMASNNYKFIYFNDRSGTVDVSVYGERALGDYADTQTAYDAAVDQFHKLYKDDEYSYFRAFIPDARNQMLLKVFVSKGLSEQRYEVKYLSDGSMSYNTSFPYRGANAYENWTTNIDIYNNMYQLAEANSEMTYNDLTLGDGYFSYELHNAYIYAAQKPNAEFWGAFPEALTSPDERVQAEINKSHLVKMPPEKLFADLSDTQKEKFLASVSFDKTTFDTTYFNNSGKYLIITGTNPVVGKFTEEQFIQLLQEIKSDYSDYNILFKPHPSSIPSDTLYSSVYSWFVENDIKILPGRLPMEVISWVYGDTLIGGFDSTLFMAVPKGNTSFFIAKSKDSLSAVSKMLYETNVFGDVKFYWSE